MYFFVIFIDIKKNIMKKITILSFLLLGAITQGQVNVQETFETSDLYDVPVGWSSSGDWFPEVSVYDGFSCNGQLALITNVYNNSTTTSITTQNYLNTSTDVTVVSYALKVIDYDTDEIMIGDFGNANLSYSIDNGTNWVSLGIVDSTNFTNSDTCGTVSYTIPAQTLVAGGTIKFKIDFNWSVGDVFFVVDDFSVQQIPNVSSLDCTVVTSNPGTDCSNGTAQLSWTAVTNAVGYKVSVGTSANNYDLVSDFMVMGTTYSVPNVGLGTTYYYKVVPTTTLIDATGCMEQNFITPEDGCLCTPIYEETGEFSDYFTNISTTGAVVNLSNESTTDSDNYSDFTSLDFEANTGDAIVFNLVYSYDGDSYVTMWVDWNNDNLMTEDERILPKELMLGEEHTFTVNIPEDALQGSYRVRIRAVYDSDNEINILPCETYEYGETEDYMLLVNNTASTNGLDLVNLKIYPNPTKDLLNITYKESISELSIFDLQGRQIMNTKVNDSQVSISTAELSSGTYLLKVVNQNKEFSIVKVVKN